MMMPLLGTSKLVIMDTTILIFKAVITTRYVAQEEISMNFHVTVLAMNWQIEKGRGRSRFSSVYCTSEWFLIDTRCRPLPGEMDGTRKFAVLLP